MCRFTKNIRVDNLSPNFWSRRRRSRKVHLVKQVVLAETQCRSCFSQCQGLNDHHESESESYDTSKSKSVSGKDSMLKLLLSVSFPLGCLKNNFYGNDPWDISVRAFCDWGDVNWEMKVNLKLQMLSYCHKFHKMTQILRIFRIFKFHLPHPLQ